MRSWLSFPASFLFSPATLFLEHSRLGRASGPLVLAASSGTCHSPSYLPGLDFLWALIIATYITL